MNYTLYFAGIICLKKTDNSYKAVLPNGVDYPDPCSPKGKKIHGHYPYLIVPQAQANIGTLPHTKRDGCFVIDLTTATSLTISGLDTGAGVIDTHPVKDGHGYRWQDIDKLTPDLTDASRVKLVVSISNGTMTEWRLKSTKHNDTAHVCELKVSSPSLKSIEVAIGGMGTGGSTAKIELIDNAEIAVANVDPKWISGGKYPNDPSHFRLYFRLDPQYDKKKPKRCKPPAHKPVHKCNGSHPFLDLDRITPRGVRKIRSIHVSCSPTYWP